MSISEEIERLNRLRLSGALTEDEFARAKRRLIDGPGDGESDDLGRAANRYVTWQSRMSVVGVIVVLIFLFGFMLPMRCESERRREDVPWPGDLRQLPGPR